MAVTRSEGIAASQEPVAQFFEQLKKANPTAPSGIPLWKHGKQELESTGNSTVQPDWPRIKEIFSHLSKLERCKAHLASWLYHLSWLVSFDGHGLIASAGAAVFVTIAPAIIPKDSFEDPSLRSIKSILLYS